MNSVNIIITEAQNCKERKRGSCRHAGVGHFSPVKNNHQQTIHPHLAVPLLGAFRSCLQKWRSRLTFFFFQSNICVTFKHIRLSEIKLKVYEILIWLSPLFSHCIIVYQDEEISSLLESFVFFSRL